VERALLVARLLLSAVFFLAGIAKLADRKGASKALDDFGLPSAFARPLSLLLSIAEIAVSAALIPAAPAWYGACAALALLGIFGIGIGIALARGRKPDCHCFGQLHSAPVGRSTFIRNGILAAVAAWLVFRGPMQDGPPLWQHLAAAGDDERRLFLIAACVMCFLIFRALRRKDPEQESDSIEVDWEDSAQSEPSIPGPERQLDPELQRILQTGTGWPIGTPARDFTLPDITGRQCSLQSLRDKGTTVCLVFSSPFCEPCRALWPSITRWAREYDRALNIIVISRGSATENLAKQNDFEPSRVLLQQTFELSDAYGVTSTPAAVLVGADGLIQSRLAVGRDDIRQLIAASVQDSPRATSSI